MAITEGDIYRGTINYLMANQQCMNVLHFRATVAGNQSFIWNELMGNLLNRLEAIAVQMSLIMHNSVLINKVSVTGIHGPNGIHARERTVNIEGAKTGELLPGFVALPFYITSGYAGRSRRGRFHQGGWTEDDQNGGTLSSSGETNAGALQTVLQTQLLASSQWQGIIYSRLIADREGYGATDAVPQAEGQPATPWVNITAVTRGNVLGSMYSRKIGRGS